MKIKSREYKVMLDHQRFVDRAAVMTAFWEELERVAGMVPVEVKGKLEKKGKRRIAFLDTPDHTLRQSGLILRQRSEEEAVEYTLKCRSDDFWFAGGTDVGAVEKARWETRTKLEEDIAPPFRCRFSHSSTVTLTGNAAARPGTPQTLSAAAAIFPLLATLRHDGKVCPPDTPLPIVHDLTVHERVFTGAKFVFRKGKKSLEMGKATVAVILWSEQKDSPPLVAEFSFRIKDPEENSVRDLAAAARSLFQAVQQSDWCRPDAMTKTAFVYRDTVRD